MNPQHDPHQGGYDFVEMPDEVFQDDIFTFDENDPEFVKKQMEEYQKYEQMFGQK